VLAALVTITLAARADTHWAWHVRYGGAYFLCLAAVCALVVPLRCSRAGWPLFFLGTAAFALATASRLRCRPGRVVHVLGMGGSLPARSHFCSLFIDSILTELS
jgi:hypothetical protein